MKLTSTLLLVVLSLASFASLASSFNTLSQGSSLSTEKPEAVLTSPNGVFSAGFYPVGENAYCFAVWFTQQTRSHHLTVIWTANRDQPVNGRLSKLSLLETGDLILTDAGQFTVWATSTLSRSSAQLNLYNTGNLVLRTLEGENLWESFDFPTDTLLPQQFLTRNTKLVSSRSQSNYSSGFYKLLFDYDNILRLVYDSPNFSSIYWPDPGLLSWDTGRSRHNNSRTAVLDSLGNFSSSDRFTFMSTDYGQMLHRRLTLDYDGNIRLYSWDEQGETWVVSWQAIQKPCKIHGMCGENSICSYFPDSGRKCSCLPGYRMRNPTDWSYGCEAEFVLSCKKTASYFQNLSHTQFYGNDYGMFLNHTFHECKNLCLKLCEDCKAFQYVFKKEDGFSSCYPKALLRNGYHSPDFTGTIYLKMPKSAKKKPFSYANSTVEPFSLDCSIEGPLQPNRTYLRSRGNGTVKLMLWFVCGLGGLEIVCIFSVCCLLVRTRKNSGENKQGYLFTPTGLRKFTYAELKKATKGFTEEIGRGAGGIVYRGVLADNRVAAVKRLNVANQGEDIFLAEVSILGRLNHMHLIEMWGYCAQGKHRLLVSEYMEHGSLAQNLASNSLDWKKRFEIALGTAKGLAYLHEECLEWVLHCDVKPENILLDSDYQPKVADFGLSKLQNRGDSSNSTFSRMRGTRGYMAPEWVFNLPITSKVDVYSYGIVVLVMVTGKSTQIHAVDDAADRERKSLVTWVREKKNGEATKTCWIEDVIDPIMEGRCDMGKMEMLVSVALQCVEEDKNARPTMSQVVDVLHHHKDIRH
ncbi:putative receptor protein kinase ZmPK1 [Morella rubra]|uniref:Receptor-like serine/threonine-protein kinase n=1 Tax=Morella rubra TaxID=262757 RepID=A0A6A1W4Z8_9ROSI|nr:putative receptor protein kinase ZmPK1 [Morella rubra]